MKFDKVCARDILVPVNITYDKHHTSESINESMWDDGDFYQYTLYI